MSFVTRYLGTGPVILIAVPDRSHRRAIETIVSDHLPYDRRSVEEPDALVDALDEAVHCVVTTDAWLDRVADAVADRLDAAPIVVSATGPTDRLLAIANDRRVAACLDSEGRAYEESLIEAVESAVDQYAGAFEDRLKRSAIDSLIEYYNEAVYLKDDAGTYMMAADSEYWPGPAHMLGQTDVEMDEEDDGIEFMQQRHDKDVAVARGGDPVINEVTRHGDENFDFWRESTRIPWETTEGDPIGMIGHSRDITDEKERIAALEDKIRQLERFTSYVSHDLQSPLQVASGYLELAQAGDESAFDRVAEAHGRMSELIDDLQTMSGEESFGVKTRAVDLGSLAQSVWRVVDTDDATLEVALPDDSIINASKAEVRPLLENLFKNAITHGPASDDDSVRVTVGALDDGFYVADDGRGIPPDERDQIFDEGYTTADRGTGTGLAIVADAAETNNWDLDVTESDAGGARFEFRNSMMVTDRSTAETGQRTYDPDQRTDIGDLKVEGSVTHDSETGEWTITAAGADIWQEKNEFRFAYTAVDGPVRIQGRVTDIEDVNPYSKAGFMVRDELTDDTSHGYIGTTPGAGAEVTWSSGSGELTRSQQLEEGAKGFEWFRIDRVGEQVTCSVSADGDEWLPVDQRTVPLSDPVYVGLVVCSVVPRVNCTASFADVTVQSLES